MQLLGRTTLIAALLTVVGVLTLTLSVTRVMHLSSPPSDFDSWPAPKKEAYLYEHRPATLAGFELLRTWVSEPSTALPYVEPQAALTFSLSWVAAFLRRFVAKAC